MKQVTAEQNHMSKDLIYKNIRQHEVELLNLLCSSDMSVTFNTHHSGHFPDTLFAYNRLI